MDLNPLEEEIRTRIARVGPMPVHQYMALCLGHPEHGYYTSRDPFGRAGDFVTAPEISQMFGELIGLWAAEVWRLMGEPENVRLVELGPGRGTMMHDALRAARVVPAFHAAIVAHLVETSPVLRERQQQTLANVGVPLVWHDGFSEVPPGPMILLANEFFDALPVSQAVKAADGWHERTVEVAPSGELAFSMARDPLALFERLLPPELHDVPPGTIHEWRSDIPLLEIGRRIVHERGAGLVIDYGYVEPGIGETLQAVRGHDYAPTLADPGRADITAHVDFTALGRAVEGMGARLHGPVPQSAFLASLGIARRAEALRAHATPQQGDEIDAAVARLIRGGRTGMGSLFKALAFGHPDLGPLPGFEAPPDEATPDEATPDEAAPDEAAPDEATPE